MGAPLTLISVRVLFNTPLDPPTRHRDRDRRTLGIEECVQAPSARRPATPARAWRWAVAWAVAAPCECSWRPRLSLSFSCTRSHSSATLRRCSWRLRCSSPTDMACCRSRRTRAVPRRRLSFSLCLSVRDLLFSVPKNSPRPCLTPQKGKARACSAARHSVCVCVCVCVCVFRCARHSSPARAPPSCKFATRTWRGMAGTL